MGHCEHAPTARKASGWYGFANAMASFILFVSHEYIMCLLASIQGNIRAIFRLHPNFVEDGKLNALAAQPLDRLLHRIQLAHGGVGDDAHALRADVLEVHPDFLGGAGTEPDARRRHLEGVLLLA